MIGAEVNRLLQPFGAKIGPDPASIGSCMLGGILANNSSGMCCGVVDNAYHTLEAMRFVLPNGLELDSADPKAEDVLREIAIPDLGYIPSHEPERGPGVRMFHACATVPLLYMPIRGAGLDPVPDWMRDLDPAGKVEYGMTQKEVRRWMREHPGHRSFTVLRHPLPRAYDAFCRFIQPFDVEGYAEIREALISRYNVPLPSSDAGQDWTLVHQQEAFLAFLRFLAGNLGGQTSVRVDYSWSSQQAFLEAIARFSVPDCVIRDHSISTELKHLSELIGLAGASWRGGSFGYKARYPLEDVRTAEIDEACAAAYRRDYVFFGFTAWRSLDQAA